MKSFIFIIASTALAFTGCTSTPVETTHRAVASVSDTCAKLVQKIKDAKTLEDLGCASDGSAADTFHAKSEWHQGNQKVFNEVETDGIKMDALQDGLRKCQKVHTLCVLKNVDETSVQTDGDLRKVEFEVVIQGVDSYIDNSEMKKFNEEDRNASGEQTTPLMLLAAQYGAVTKALGKCYKAGYVLCAIAGVNLTETNSYDSSDQTYNSAAKATVIGLNFVRPTKTSYGAEQNFKVQFKAPVPTFEFPARGKDI